MNKQSTSLTSRDPGKLPLALDQIEDIFAQIGDRQPAVFLDYDGTLSPIVSNPDNAHISDAMRRQVQQLAEYCPVAIISGRDRRDVEHRVGLRHLIYAGSHGFDISGPEARQISTEFGEEFLPHLTRAGEILESRLSTVSGARVERKRFSIALHYRNVAAENIEQVRKHAKEVIERFSDLKLSGGKKILEIQPDLDWDKGKALQWLMEKLDLRTDQYCPLYIGDDLTDENAFEALRDHGIGILVGNHNASTQAQFHLNNVDEVRQFLRQMVTDCS